MCPSTSPTGHSMLQVSLLTSYIEDACGVPPRMTTESGTDAGVRNSELRVRNPESGTGQAGVRNWRALESITEAWSQELAQSWESGTQHWSQELYPELRFSR